LATLPSLIGEQPPDVQLVTGKVLKTSWRDPTDTTPTAAKVAREVSGWRQYCPLRKCLARHRERSSFTARHIEGADRLRAAFDGARLGFSGLKSWEPVHRIAYRPSSGPGTTALKQLKARQVFDAAWGLFDDPARALLGAVVLANVPLGISADRLGLRKPRATTLLVDVLDRLADHFQIEEEPRRAA
jgi:hypothetical protein